MDFKINRREFIKGACVAGGVFAFGSLLGCEEKPKKLIITKEELNEFDLITCYTGDNCFELALIKTCYESSNAFTSNSSYAIKILRTSNDSISEEILKSYYGLSTVELYKEQFYNDYNIVKTDSAVRVFQSYLGVSDYYTIDDINYVFEEEKKCLEQKPQKQLIR